MKYSYRNSCFFGYTIKSISKKTGLSRTAVRRNVSIFLDRGWCELHSGNLIFKDLDALIFQEGIFNKHDKLCSKKHYTILKIRSNDKKIFAKLFYLELYQNKIRQVKRISDKAHDLLDPCGRHRLHSHKLAIKFWRGVDRSKIFQLNENAIALSLRTIAKLFKCSLTKAHQLIEFFIDNKLIKAIKGKMECIGRANTFIENLPSDHFYFKGMIFHQPCTQYVVGEQQGIISFTKKTH